MSFQAGIETLLSRHRGWVGGQRVGLLSHAAAVCEGGETSAELLWQAADVELVALFGPEHGFDIARGAGERCDSRLHNEWGIPIHSLYGDTRRPTEDMLEGLDVLLIDLQDLGVRAYTYVSTIRNTLEACSDAGIGIIVADRPVPLANTVDGAVTQPDCSSFVSAIDAPLSYGMTPAETARWVVDHYGLDLSLRVSLMRDYARDADPGHDWPSWRPPSPAIRSWNIGRIYPATVCFEALTSIHYGRGTDYPFGLLGSEWISGDAVADTLNGAVPGVTFAPVRYDAEAGNLPGIRISVTDASRYRPAATAVSTIHVLQELYGKDCVWKDARQDFFDKLMGTRDVREALLDGEAPSVIVAAWEPGLAMFRGEREDHLLYRESAQ